MKPESSETIDTAIRELAEKLSEESRDRLSYHADLEARDALSALIRGLEPEVLIDLAAYAALEKLRELVAENSGHGSLADTNPLHPNHGRGPHRPRRLI